MRFDIDAYLERIGLQGIGAEASLEGLQRLQAAQVKSIGFEKQPLMARVRNGGPHGGARSHMAFIVTIENVEYLADCGFGGGAPIYPIRLGDEAEHDIRGETYRLQLDNETGEEVLERLVEGEWHALYGFDRAFVQDIDFEAANFVTARWEKAPFPNNLMMSLVTNEGRNTLFNRALKITRGNEVQAKTIGSFVEFQDALTAFFRLQDNRQLFEDVWRRIEAK